MFLVLGIFIVLLIIIGILFVNLSPQFGGKATVAQKKVYEKSDNYKDEKFFNKNGVTADMSFGDMMKAAGQMFKNNPDSRPKENISVQKNDSREIANYRGDTRLMWFGHSSFLLQTRGKPYF